jgi:hypothetical protein
MDAASQRPYFFHQLTSRMVFSKAEMFLKRPPVTLSPSPRMTLPATVSFHALEPNEAVIAPTFPSRMMEATQGTQEEPLELSSSSSSSLSCVSLLVSRELSILQTQTMRRTSSIQSDKEDSEATTD